ncbi:MAG: alpha/beta hydrolase [Nitriliruptoraceae bacterium]
MTPTHRLLLTGSLVALVLGGPLVVPASESATRGHRDLAYPDSRFERLAGVDVHHLDAGSSDGETLLLSHHFYGSAPTWRKVVDRLQDRHRLVAFDRPGFGLTERVDRQHWDGANPYTRDAAARIGWELLDHLDVEEAVLVGSSAGGTNVLEMYARQPARVRALVLVSPAITGDVGPPDPLRPLLRSPQARRLAPHAIRRLVGEVDAARVGASWADPARATESDAEPYQRMLEVEGWERGFWEAITAEASPDLSDLLPRIEVPVLLVTGGADRVIAPRSSQRTAEVIPQARFERLDDCGHTPQEECPERLAMLIADFLTGLDGR